jgi:hypothetical protein
MGWTILGSNSAKGKKFSLLKSRPERLWAPTPILLFFPGSKRLPQEFDHSHPPDTEVKDAWSYKSAPPICHLGVDREHFTLIFSITSRIFKILS